MPVMPFNLLNGKVGGGALPDSREEILLGAFEGQAKRAWLASVNALGPSRVGKARGTGLELRLPFLLDFEEFSQLTLLPYQA